MTRHPLLSLFAAFLFVAALTLSGCELDDGGEGSNTDTVSDSTNPSTATVHLGTTGVQEETVSINLGGTVTFVNNDDVVHKMEFSDASIGETSDIQPGSSTTAGPFNSKGSFGYSGLYNANYYGVVVVTD